MKRSRDDSRKSSGEKRVAESYDKQYLLPAATRIMPSYDTSELEQYLFNLEPRVVTPETHLSLCPGLPLRLLSRSSLSLSFLAPERIDVVGSFALKTQGEVSRSSSSSSSSSRTSPPVIDLAVEMPAACFSAGSRDAKNFSYLDKRAMYLGVLAQEV